MAKRPVSIAALERALAEKQQQVASLQRRRQALLKRVAKVDKDIAALTGKPAASAGQDEATTRPKKAKTKLRRRPKNAMTLRDAIVAVLSKSRKPLTAREMADGVLATGYRSKSKNLLQRVWTTVGKDERIDRREKGKYMVRAKKK